jgi:hypothetical protein
MTAGLVVVLVVVLLTLSPTGGDLFSAGLLTWLIGLAATVAHPDRMVAGRPRLGTGLLTGGALLLSRSPFSTPTGKGANETPNHRATARAGTPAMPTDLGTRPYSLRHLVVAVTGRIREALHRRCADR